MVGFLSGEGRWLWCEVATEARIWSGLGEGYWLRKGMIIASTFSNIRTSRGLMRKREIMYSLFFREYLWFD
jgi:hypothetical protein